MVFSFLKKPGTKPFIFGFLHAALLAFVLGSIPMFEMPYGSPVINCIKAPCFQPKVSLFKYPQATKIANQRLQERISILVEENNKLEDKLGRD